MKTKSVKFLVGATLTALALWLSFRNLYWNDLVRSFSRVHISWVVLAVLNVLFTVYALGWRWQVLLESKQKLPMRYLFKLNIISQYLNIIVPGRFGEIAKAWLPAKRYGISGSYVLGTVVIEKIFDFFAWVILWVSVPAFFALKDKLRGYTIAIVICFALILLLALVVWKKELIRNWLYYLASLLPVKIRQRALNFLERGMEAFLLLKKTKTALIIVLYTALILLLSTLTNFLLFKAYDFNLSFFEALILLLVIQVGSAPPSIPGKIGIFEYMVILGLTLFTVNKADAMSYALMLHLVSYIPKIVLGFIFMTNLKISIKKTEAEVSKFEGTTAVTTEEALPE